MIGFFLIFFISMLILNLYLLKNIPWVLPVKLFLYFNAVMGIGILYKLDYESSADLAHALCVVMSALFYLFGSVLFSRLMRTEYFWSQYIGHPSRYYIGGVARLSIILYFLFGAITALYFYVVGYNVILTSIFSGLASGEAKELRLESYAGESYNAPGYFNQFKNILFPISFAAIVYIVSIRVRFAVARKVLYFLLIIPVLLGLLGTGQRAFLVGFFIFLFIFAFIIVRGKSRFSVATTAIAAFLFLFLFSLTSFFLGRSESFNVLDSVEALFIRVFHDNQMSAIYGFRYIFDKETVWGEEWGTDILGILPGKDYLGSDLSNQIHAVIYGSMRGTSPLSLWGSVFHNWSWIGVFIFPLFLSMLYSIVSILFLRGKDRDVLSISSYSFLFYLLGSWVASGPMQIINNGVVAVFILLALTRWYRFIRVN